MIKNFPNLVLLRTFGLSLILASGAFFSHESFAATKNDAAATDDSKDLAGCKTPPGKRQLKSLSQKFFKKVAEVDVLTNPEPDKNGKAPEPDYKAAWPKLKKLVDKCDDCNDYEWAQLYQRAAFIRYNMEDVPAAIDYFKKVVSKSPNIPASLETQLLFQIAQLLTSQDKYTDSNVYFDKWEAMCPAVVPADYYYYKAQNFYLLGKKPEALKTITRGIELSEAKGNLPKESWYKLQMAIYLDKEDFKSAEKVAEVLAVKYTNARIMSQLASLYGMNGKSTKQLAVLDALNVANLLDKEGDYKNLAFLYLEGEAPYLASRVMKKGVDKKVVSRTAKNLEVWAASLAQAQETQKSLPIMEEAAEKSEDGKIYSRLAAIYLSADEFKKAVTASNHALEKGKLKSNGEVYMYLGSAYLSLENYNSAIESLQKALKDEKYKTYAENLINYIKGEQKRSDALKKAKMKS